jgi:hypothetical protein
VSAHGLLRKTLALRWSWWLLVSLVGCCEPKPAAVVPTTPPAVESPGVSERRCEANCKLTLTLRAAPGGSALDLQFEVKNATQNETLWITSRPRFASRSFNRRRVEMEISLVDSNGREVTEHCLEAHAPDRSGFVALPPGQSVTTSYSLRPGCYILVPGESLNVVASYMKVDDWPDPPPGTIVLDESISTGRWQTITVPKEWSNAARR